MLRPFVAQFEDMSYSGQVFVRKLQNGKYSCRIGEGDDLVDCRNRNINKAMDQMLGIYFGRRCMAFSFTDT